MIKVKYGFVDPLIFNSKWRGVKFKRCNLIKPSLHFSEYCVMENQIWRFSCRGVKNSVLCFCALHFWGAHIGFICLFRYWLVCASFRTARRSFTCAVCVHGQPSPRLLGESIRDRALPSTGKMKKQWKETRVGTKTHFLFLNHELLSLLCSERECFSEMINKCRLHQLESTRKGERQRLGDLQNEPKTMFYLQRILKENFWWLHSHNMRATTESLDPQLAQST